MILDGVAIGCEPELTPLGPVYATKKICTEQNLKIDDFDTIEIDEAFAAQTLACEDWQHCVPVQVWELLWYWNLENHKTPITYSRRNYVTRVSEICSAHQFFAALTSNNDGSYEFLDHTSCVKK